MWSANRWRRLERISVLSVFPCGRCPGLSLPTASSPFVCPPLILPPTVLSPGAGWGQPVPAVQLIVQNSGVLEAGVSSLKIATKRVFTPQKSANPTHQNLFFFFFSQLPSTLLQPKNTWPSVSLLFLAADGAWLDSLPIIRLWADTCSTVLSIEDIGIFRQGFFRLKKPSKPIEKKLRWWEFLPQNCLRKGVVIFVTHVCHPRWRGSSCSTQ